MRIETMCAHIQAEYDVLLRSKSQLKQYFQRLSEKPFLHIESYTYQPLYKAGNIFGMMARDRQIDEILEEKGKEEREDFPLEQGFVVSSLAVKK